MKIDNTKVVWKANMVYFIFLCVFLIALSLSILVNANSYDGIFLKISAISFLLLLLWSLRGHPHFIYDSEGEVINIRNPNAFLAKFFALEEKPLEIPKGKLLDFKIENFILKKNLILYINSKSSARGYIKSKYSISYLNKNQIHALEASLRKIIKQTHIESANATD